MSVDLCLVIHNIGLKHDRERKISKLTFMLLTLHASLLREISVSFWALFDTQLLNFIWKYVLLIILVTYRDNFLSLIFMNIFRSIVCYVVGSAPKYLVFYQSDNFENSHGHLPMGKNSHVQFWFIDFWVDVQRGTLSFVFVCTRNKIPAQTSHEVLTVDS